MSSRGFGCYLQDISKASTTQDYHLKESECMQKKISFLFTVKYRNADVQKMALITECAQNVAVSIMSSPTISS